MKSTQTILVLGFSIIFSTVVNAKQTKDLKDQVDANTSAIAGNTSAIAGNTSAIAGNTSAIAGNTSALSSLDTRVGTLEGSTGNVAQPMAVFSFVDTTEDQSGHLTSLRAFFTANPYNGTPRYVLIIYHTVYQPNFSQAICIYDQDDLFQDLIVFPNDQGNIVTYTAQGSFQGNGYPVVFESFGDIQNLSILTRYETGSYPYLDALTIRMSNDIIFEIQDNQEDPYNETRGDAEPYTFTYRRPTNVSFIIGSNRLQTCGF